MKRTVAAVGLCVFILLFSACSLNPGRVDQATVDLGDSDLFSEEELRQASDCVLAKFKAFEGCELQKLWYDEQFSSGMYGDGNVLEMVLLSDFHVDEDPRDGGLSPDTDYTSWQWLLIRDSETSKWVVRDWGYG